MAAAAASRAASAKDCRQESQVRQLRRGRPSRRALAATAAALAAASAAGAAGPAAGARCAASCRLAAGCRAAPAACGSRGRARPRGVGRRAAGRAAEAGAAEGGPAELAGRWWNETVEFWDALELWEATPLKEDERKEAVDLVRQLDLINATLREYDEAKRARVENGLRAPQPQRGRTADKLGELTAPLPGLVFEYYRMRIAFTLSKRVVKKGLSSSVLYANFALIAIFLRVVAPRLVAAGSMDDLFEVAENIGIPDRATLAGYLQTVQDFDLGVKVACYTGAFVIEKLLMLSEFLPIQIGLKTIAPVIFGGLWQGALASAFTETLAACCNFFIGRRFFSERLQEASFFGGEPVGKAKWYGKLVDAATSDGFRLVLLMRLAPVLPIPFDSYWYLLGALPVGLPAFAAAHFVGCLKTAFLDASFGVLLLTSVSIDTSAAQAQAQQVLLLEVTALAVVAVLIGTVATKLMNDILMLDEEEVDDKEESISVGDSVRVVADEQALRHALSLAGLEWDDDMRRVLGTTQEVLAVDEEGGLVGLKEAIADSGEPVWYYPLSCVSLQGAGTGIKFTDAGGDVVELTPEGDRVVMYVNGCQWRSLTSFDIDKKERTYNATRGHGSFKKDEDLELLERRVHAVFADSRARETQARRPTAAEAAPAAAAHAGDAPARPAGASGAATAAGDSAARRAD